MNKKVLFLLSAAMLLSGCGQQPTPTTSSSTSTSSSEVDTRLAITFNGNDNAFPVSLPEKANAGETIFFKVAATSGYEVTEVTVADAEGTEVTLEGNVNDGFTFVMPSKEVTVNALAQGAYFKCATLADEVVFATEVSGTEKKVKDFVAGFMIGDEQTPSLGQEKYIRAGTSCKVLVNLLAIGSDIKAFMGEDELEHSIYEVKNEEGEVTDRYNVYDFVMPNHNADISITGTETTFSFATTEDTTHSTKIATYSKVDDEYVECKDFKAGQDVYLKVEMSAEQKISYTLKGATSKYRTYSGYSLKESATETKATFSKVEGEENVYKWSPTTYTNYTSKDFTIEAEFSVNKYAGKEFVGEFSGSEAYTFGSKWSTIAGKTFTADATGAATYNYSKGNIDGVDEVNKTFNIGSKKFWYDEDLITWQDGSNFKDMHIVARSSSNLTFVAPDTSSKDGIVWEAYFTNAGGSKAQNIVVIDDKVYLNVEVNFTDGTVVNSSSTFTLLKDGVVVASYTPAIS